MSHPFPTLPTMLIVTRRASVTGPPPGGPVGSGRHGGFPPSHRDLHVQLRRRAPRVPRRGRLLRPLRGTRAQRRRARAPARARWRSPASAATPGGWTRWRTTRWPSSSPRPPTSPASSTRRSSTARVCPGPTSSTWQLLRDVFAECKRVLEPGGRIAVNVANLGRKPYRSLAADVMTILQDDLHLLPRGEIVWQKGEGASGSCAWGSFRSPTNPVLRDVTERVIVASKGRFGRARSPKERRARRAAAREQHRRRRLHGADPRRVGHPARERHAGAAPGPLPGGAAPAADGALHLHRGSRRRPFRRLGLDAGGGPARPDDAPWATTSTRPTSSWPGPGWPRRTTCPQRRARWVAVAAGPVAAGPTTAPRRPRWPRRRSTSAGFADVRANRRLRGLGLAVDFHGERRRRLDVVLRRRRVELRLPGRHGQVRDGVADPRSGPRHGQQRREAPGGPHDSAASARHRGRPGPAGPGPGGLLRRHGSPLSGRPAADGAVRRGRTVAPAGRILVGRGPGARTSR